MVEKNEKIIQQKAKKMVKKTENIIKKLEKQGNKSVSNTNALTNTLCDTVRGQLGSLEWSERIYEDMSKESLELAYLFYFQFESGCRISEIISISHEDILRDGSVKIRGKKNSNDRIINCSKSASWLIYAKKIKRNPFGTFNRFFIHRFYKKFGVIFYSENSRKASTTHALRQLKAEAIREVDNSNELISKSLGQKNPENAKFYGKSKK